MKRITAIILTLALLALLPSCGGQAVRTKKPDANEKLSVVCTVFPQYDWVRQILGRRADSAELTLLESGGADLHSFQPSVEDIIRITECDLLIYVGGESDEWVGGILEDAENRNMLTINLLETLGSAAKEEEIVEGMAGDGEDETALDEHVWLSLKNAEIFCAAITDALISLDYAGVAEYRENLRVYTERLREMDARYRTAVEAASVKTLLFGDRFPFRYLTDDYGMSYYAAFPGCSAETEAGFETIVFLVAKMDELGLNAVITTESSDGSIASTIINNTGRKDQRVFELDSMQSLMAEDASYLSIMESNLNVLKEALK